MDLKEEVDFEGCNFLRLRICFSVLSGRPVTIKKIRENEDEPGIKDYESKLLSLMEKITNGTKIWISKTGTEVKFTPGMITGGIVNLNCGTQRCLSYFLEPLIFISPFCKLPLRAKLSGVTNAPGELSVDAMKVGWLKVYNKFVLNDEQLDLVIQSRGLKPEGGGLVIFTSPIVKTLRPAMRVKPGKICKIRGMAYVTKVSPSLANRLIESAKKGLRDYISDVYITVDQRKGDGGGKSPGYGIFLYAETTDGVFYTAEALSNPKGAEADPRVPEDIGTEAAHNLLNEVYRGGCCDSSAQPLAALFMTLGDKDISKFLMGPLSVYTVNVLRHIRKYFLTTFKIDDYSLTEAGQKEIDADMQIGNQNKCLMTTLGAGYSNLNKVVL